MRNRLLCNSFETKEIVSYEKWKSYCWYINCGSCHRHRAYCGAYDILRETGGYQRNNSDFRANAKNWAETYATYNEWYEDTPGFYRTTVGQECTNFVSACVSKGGLVERWGTDQSDISKWYYEGEIILGWRHNISSHTWTLASAFAKHWGHDEKGVGNQRAYKTIVYYCGEDALTDWNYLYNNLYNGDVVQMFDADGVHHSMIVYNDVASTSYGSTDILLAQHTNNEKNKSLRAIFLKYSGASNQEGFIIHRIK